VLLSAIEGIVEFASERGDMGRVVLSLYECGAAEGPPIAQHSNSETGNETSPLNRMSLVLPPATAAGGARVMLDSACYVGRASGDGVTLHATLTVDGSLLTGALLNPVVGLQYHDREGNWVDLADSIMSLGKDMRLESCTSLGALKC
jgi:hypothetical protein